MVLFLSAAYYLLSALSTGPLGSEQSVCIVRHHFELTIHYHAKEKIVLNPEVHRRLEDVTARLANLRDSL